MVELTGVIEGISNLEGSEKHAMLILDIATIAIPIEEAKKLHWGNKVKLIIQTEEKIK